MLPLFAGAAQSLVQKAVCSFWVNRRHSTCKLALFYRPALLCWFHAA